MPKKLVKWRFGKPWAESGFTVEQHKAMPKKHSLMAGEKFLVLLSKRIPLETRKKALDYYVKNSSRRDIKQMSGGRRLPATNLIIAINTLYKEKELNSRKTLKQIAAEMTAKGFGITPPTLKKINRALRFFTQEEITEIGNHARRRKRVSQVAKKKRVGSGNGSTGGKRISFTPTEILIIRQLRAKGNGASAIARKLGNGRSESGIRSWIEKNTD